MFRAPCSKRIHTGTNVMNPMEFLLSVYPRKKKNLSLRVVYMGLMFSSWLNKPTVHLQGVSFGFF